MDSALQLGQSSVQMSFTADANTVLNCMSERLYSAEKEVYSLFTFSVGQTYICQIVINLNNNMTDV